MASVGTAIWKRLAGTVGVSGIIGIIGTVCAAQLPAATPFQSAPVHSFFPQSLFSQSLPPQLTRPNNNIVTLITDNSIRNRPVGFLQRSGNVLGGSNVTTYVNRETRLVENDEKRAYVLLGPGGRGYPRRRIMRMADGTFSLQTDSPPPNKTTLPVSAAGLLVVLPPGDGDGLQFAAFWSDVMKNVLKGRYYVALAVAPHWEGLRPTTWLTDTNVKQVKDARFSTETLAADIAKDVSSIYNIDPQRVFLHGAAESGLAVYACSLHDTTPFKGFYIHDAPFRAAQLPSLVHARGRRYFLQQSQDDKADPLWMADAARKLLTDQGATVKMTTYRGSGPYIFTTDNRWETMTEAITWLEAGAAPATRKN